MVFIPSLIPLGKSLDASDPQNKEFIQDIKDEYNEKHSPYLLNCLRETMPPFIPEDLNKRSFCLQICPILDMIHGSPLTS